MFYCHLLLFKIVLNLEFSYFLFECVILGCIWSLYSLEFHYLNTVPNHLLSMPSSDYKGIAGLHFFYWFDEFEQKDHSIFIFKATIFSLLANLYALRKSEASSDAMLNWDSKIHHHVDKHQIQFLIDWFNRLTLWLHL